MKTKLEMEQLEIILGNYQKKDGNRDAAPKISDGSKGGAKESKSEQPQAKAAVLEASKSFQSSESRGSMLAPKDSKEPTGNRVRFQIPAESEEEVEATPTPSQKTPNEPTPASDKPKTPEKSGPPTPTPDANMRDADEAEAAATTPRAKTPNKEETLDTPHFENEDTDELQKVERSEAPAKKFSPLEV